MCRKTTLPFIISILTLSGFSTAGATLPTMPFDLSESVVISEENNLMSHGSSFLVTPSGKAYVIYQRDSTQIIESGEKLTIEMRVVSFPVKDWRNADKYKRMTVLKGGEPVGDLVLSGHCPADAVMQLMGDRIACIIAAGENGRTGYVVRYLDTVNDSLSDYVDRCDFSYISGGKTKTVPLDNIGIAECYRDLGFGEAEKLEMATFGKRFIAYDGYYYNVLSGWCCPQSRPVILRTKDFINFEAVFVCKEFMSGGAESSISIIGDELYVIARSTRPEDKSRAGCYIAKYSMDGTCLVKPWMIGNKESRSVLYDAGGKLYAVYNVLPELFHNGKKVNRSHIRISETDKNANSVRGWDLTMKDSFQYYELFRHKGRNYIVFVEDRQRVANGSRKGNIGFAELNL